MAAAYQNIRSGRLAAGLSVQLRVFRALILRELHSRYGRENIGFLWVIGEPMLFGSVITLLHLSQNTHYASDMQPAPFMIIGYVIYIIFRNTFNRADGAIESNQPLLYHRQVTVFDVVSARVIMEILGCFTAIVILMTFAIVAGYAQLPERPLYLITAACFMGWWTFGLTLIAASVAYRRELVARQLHIISYFSIPVSGAFIALSWMPAGLRDALAWFPMALIFEQARYGQFRAASARFVDPAYVALCCAAVTLVGLIMIRRAQRQVYGG